MGAQDDFVAVLEEPAFLTVGQLDWFGTAPSELEQAAARILGFARDRAAAEQVPGLEVAAVAGVMGEELGEGPVQFLEIARGEAMRGLAGSAHLGCEQENFQSDIEG